MSESFPLDKKNPHYLDFNVGRIKKIIYKYNAHFSWIKKKTATLLAQFAFDFLLWSIHQHEASQDTCRSQQVDHIESMSRANISY